MTRRGGGEWSEELRVGIKSGEDETGARWIPPARHEKISQSTSRQRATAAARVVEERCRILVSSCKERCRHWWNGSWDPMSGTGVTARPGLFFGRSMRL